MEARPSAPFGELLTATLTPFDEDGAVDYGTYWRLVRHLAENGTEGIVVSGTTGESPTLSKVEKIALFKAAVDAAGGNLKVIAGVGTYDTAASVALAEKAAEMGCDGLMAVTPYYSKPPQEGLYRHFTAIAEATDLPLMLYNIPSRTARLIEIDTLVRLAEHPKIVAVKDAVDDIDFSLNAIAALPEGFAVYAGNDSTARRIVGAGGVGVVSVAAHFVGPQLRRLLDAVKAGDDDEAARIDEALAPLIAALFAEPSPIPLKGGMSAWWGSVGEPRLPLIPASPETLALIESGLEVAQAV